MVLLVLVLAMVCGPAYAVVPGLVGPVQAILGLLPAILAALGACLGTLLSFPTWKQRAKKLLSVARRRPVVVLAVVCLAVVVGYTAIVRPPAAVTGDARAAVATGEWPTFRAGPARLGTTDGEPVGPSPAVLWSKTDKAAQASDFSSSPAVAGGRAYIGSAQASVFSSSGAIHCFDASTGQLIWRTPVEQQVFSSPVVANGRVCCGEGLHQDSGSRLYCLDARTGRKLWSFPTKSHAESTPVVVSGKVVFTAGDDGAYCLNAVTGKRLWQRGGMHADISPLVVGRRVVIGTGYGAYQALCLDLDSGKVLWRTKQDLPVWGAPGVSGSRVYLGLGNGDFTKSDPHPKGRLVCLSLADGSEVWHRDVPDAVLTAAAVRDGRVVFGSRDGKVYALSADRGRLLWSAEAGKPVLGSPVLTARYVYAAGGDGSVRCFNAATGKAEWILPRVSPSGFLGSPALVGGRLFVGSPNGAFICIAGR